MVQWFCPLAAQGLAGWLALSHPANFVLQMSMNPASEQQCAAWSMQASGLQAVTWKQASPVARWPHPGRGKMLVTPACFPPLFPLLMLVELSSPASEPALMYACLPPFLGLVQLPSHAIEPAQADRWTKLHQMVSVWCQHCTTSDI